MIPRCVIDATFALAWFFPDESTPGTEEFLRRLAVRAIGAVGPIFLEAEVANAFSQAERRGLLTPAQADRFFEDFASLRIEMPDSYESPFGSNLLLGKRLGLSPVAASYLNLAMDRRLPFATLDPLMVKSAKSLGIELLD
jgi:predicted nucleic acid-binding protein